jgi:membrane protease YdiL (CAAX protease family)
MQPMATVLLILLLLLLFWFVRNDAKEYAAFKTVESSEERQSIFRRWVLRSFLLFVGSAILALLLLGRVEALVRMPPEFAPLARIFAGFGGGGGGASTGFIVAVSLALVAGAAAGAALARRGRSNTKAKPKPRPPVIGDIEPLLPRNAAERKWTALLAANAGPGEELFFRLVLPLLIAIVTGNAWIAFAASSLIFGAVHFYQGWVGIVATMLGGLVFAAFYLATGSIWLAALVHSLMNLNTLWLRPLLNDRAGRT